MTGLVAPAQLSALLVIDTQYPYSPQDALDPRHDLVRRRVRRLVEVDNTALDVRLDVALMRRATVGNGRKVASSDEYCNITELARPRSLLNHWFLPGKELVVPRRARRTSLVVLEQEGPVARVDGRSDGLRLNDLLLLLGGARLHNIHCHIRYFVVGCRIAYSELWGLGFCQ